MIAFYVTRRLNKLKKVNSNLLIPKAEHIMDKKIEKLLEEIGLQICLKEEMFELDLCKGGISQMAPIILESLVYKYMDADFVCPLL